MEKKLRLALRINATSSVFFGILGLAFADQIVEFLGAGTTLIVRLVSAGLIMFAVFVVHASTLSLEQARANALLISIGDIGWVAGSATLIGLGVFTPSGGVAATIIAILVLGYAVAQLYTRTKTAGL